jgi:hypothetical protein
VTATVNGWRVLERSQCADLQVPGGVLPVHPALAPIFADLTDRFHHEVEPLEWPGCWGWAPPRPIRGKTGGPVTNHGSGTAIDLNAPRHPQGVPVGKTFTRAQVSAVSAILARYGGLIVWGGTWDAPDTDGMHFELRTGATFEQVSALAAKLAGPTPPPTPPPPPAAGFTGPDLTGSGAGLRGQATEPQTNGPRMAALQAFLRAQYPLYAKHLDADGWYGPQTAAVLAEFARRSGVRGADGLNIGPQIAAALTRAGFGRGLSAARLKAAGHITRGARR